MAVFIVSGCGGTRPMAELGLNAYEGNNVKVDPSYLFGMIGGEQNKLDTSVQRNAARDVQPLRIFVDQAEIDELDTSKNVVFSKESIRRELTKAVEDSATKWGRFVRVSDANQANLIVKPRLSTMVAWGDWSKSLDDLSAKYKGLTGQALQDVTREGLDVRIILGFSRRDGTQVASSPAVGRLVSRRGEIFGKGSSDYGSGSARTEMREASVDERRLPDALAEAADGAFVASFKQLDPMLWALKPGTDGKRQWASVVTD